MLTRVQTNRHYLRDRTQAQHMRAESSWTRDGRFGTRDDYQGWLSALWSVHVTLGHPAALTCGGALARSAEQSRVDALRADLAETSCDLPQHAGAGSPSWAYGVQYALNGSAIGAATLLKSGAIPPEWPTHYLRVMRDYATSGLLGRFFAELDQTVLHLPDAAQGAAAVFDAITRAPVGGLPDNTSSTG